MEGNPLKRGFEEAAPAEPRKRSRFDQGPASAAPVAAGTSGGVQQPAPSSTAVDAIARAQAAAMAIANQLRAQPTAPASAAPPAYATAATSVAAERAAMMNAQMQAQMAAAARVAASLGTSMAASPPPPSSAASGSEPAAPKPKAGMPPPLRLDSQGRPIDENGNLIMEMKLKPVTTLKVNAPDRVVTAEQSVVKIEAAKPGAGQGKERFNPYLAHRTAAPAAENDAIAAAAAERDEQRRRRGARALHFVEAGSIAAIAEEERERMARVQAFLSLRAKGGRNRPVMHREEEEVAAAVERLAGNAAASAASAASAVAAGTPSTSCAVKEVVEGAPAASSGAGAGVPASSPAADAANATAAMPAATAPSSVAAPVAVAAPAVAVPAPAATSSSVAAVPAPVDAPAVLVAVPPKQRGPAPEVEWWDAAFLPASKQKLYAEKYSVAGQRKAAKLKQLQLQQQQGTAAASAAGSAGDETEATDDDRQGGGNGSNDQTMTDSGSLLVSPSASSAASSSSSAAAGPSFAYSELQLAAQKTHGYVQHPIPVTAQSLDAASGGAEGAAAAAAAAAAAEAPPALPLMLTKKERKKLRRRQREERHKFMQDQVRLGLLAPPEPKVKLSNLMRVLKDAAVADPSALEAKVRSEMAARQKNHDMRNLAKKLTPAERHEKWKRKMSTHSAAGPECAVFRITDLGDKQARYKVDVNARELYLTGVVLILRHADTDRGEPGALVLVEGGNWGVHKYSKLMMKRINWNRKGGENEDDEDSDEDSDDEDEDEGQGAGGAGGKKGNGAGPGGRCELIWRGTVPKRYFTEFRFEEVKTVATARKLLEGKGLVHFWDAVAASARSAAGVIGDEAASGAASVSSLATLRAQMNALPGFVPATSAGSNAAGSIAEGDDSDDDDEEDGDEVQDSEVGSGGGAGSGMAVDS